MYVSELSTSTHTFNKYHFCRGNSNKKKSRLGVIVSGKGTYIYLNKKLKVSKGDVVFIPENVYCYSEWHGAPEIKVVYLSCFMHYESFKYEPQILDVDENTKNDILQISEILTRGGLHILDAYSLFYRLLKTVIVKTRRSDIVYDKTLRSAIEYITENWDKKLSISDVAKKCCQ